MIVGKCSENFLLSSPVKNQLAPVSLVFLYFPAEFFESSFNPRYKIGWPPGHLDRVYAAFKIFLLTRKIDFFIFISFGDHKRNLNLTKSLRF